MRFAVFPGSLLAAVLPLVFPTPALAPARARDAKASLPIHSVLEGVTFDVERGSIYVPITDLRKTVGLPFRVDGGRVYLRTYAVRRQYTRRLLDGTRLVSVRGLRALGVPVFWDKIYDLPAVAHKGKRFLVRAGLKRIVVNRSEQKLRGWQGGRLVLETFVSTGRSGFSTPRGRFTAGPFKSEMHHSALYNNAPMPWTVQVIGDVCIHGSASVPRYAASHGCIRVPLTGANPARWIYDWVDRGSAVMIRDQWPHQPGQS